MFLFMFTFLTGYGHFWLSFKTFSYATVVLFGNSFSFTYNFKHFNPFVIQQVVSVLIFRPFNHSDFSLVHSQRYGSGFSFLPVEKSVFRAPVFKAVQLFPQHMFLTSLLKIRLPGGWMCLELFLHPVLCSTDSHVCFSTVLLLVIVPS